MSKRHGERVRVVVGAIAVATVGLIGLIGAAASCAGGHRESSASQASPLAVEVDAGTTPFTLSTNGSCPSFHCDPEGTGLMRHAMPAASDGGTLSARNQLLSPQTSPATCSDRDASLPACDVPGYQSCSSDDTNVVCLFVAGADSALAFDVGDEASPSRTFGLLPYTASDDDPTASRLTNAHDAKSNTGVVPLIGEDHSIIVADGNWVKRLAADGAQIWPTLSSPTATGNVGAVLGMESTAKKNRSVVGLTPLQSGGKTFIAVTFNDFVWKWGPSYANVLVFDPADGSFVAQYPPGNSDSSTSGLTVSGVNYPSASPPVAHGSSLYFVGYEEDAIASGAIVKLDLAGGALSMSASQTYGGLIPTGASPMYVDSSAYPAFPFDQVLLHVALSRRRYPVQPRLHFRRRAGDGRSPRVIRLQASRDATGRRRSTPTETRREPRPSRWGRRSIRSRAGYGSGRPTPCRAPASGSITTRRPAARTTAASSSGRPAPRPTQTAAPTRASPGTSLP